MSGLNDNIAVCLIAAVSENGVIGLKGAMPWHLPEDLKRFKELTLGKPVIMGRKTFESILSYLGRPLPGRTNIVISRGAPELRGALIARTLEEALVMAREAARREGGREIFVIGGAQIYALAMPFAARIYLTRVHSHLEGDAFFPEVAAGEWKETARSAVAGSPSCSFITLERAVETEHTQGGAP